MKALRGALVGFGGVAREGHLPGYRATRGFEIVAVVDPSPERRDMVAEALPEARVFETLQELVDSGLRLQFLDVAAPPGMHAPLTIEALGHGFHVLCEKPLGIDREGVAGIRETASRERRAVVPVHNWKHAPLLRRLHGLVVAGTIGEPREIAWEVLRCDPPGGSGVTAHTWRLDRTIAGGGILMDHGWHAFYLLPYLVGRSPTAVTATVSNRRAESLGVEDTADVSLEMGDCLGRVHLTWASPERGNRGRIVGTHGEIRIEDDALIVKVEGRPEESIRFSPSLSAGSYHPEWFPPVLETLRREIREPDARGRELAEAERCLEIILAGYASGGRRIELVTERHDAG